MDKKQLFIKLFKKAEKKYKKSAKRLAGEGWNSPWKTLIATIMSAQSRDETTIQIAQNLFKKYPNLSKLSKAKFSDILKIFNSLNYNRTKAKNTVTSAKILIYDFKGKIPDNIEKLTTLPGVGRKTANLILAEIHNKNAICVDTHVNRLANVLGLVRTKTTKQTELALQKISPKKYWSKINHIFVLWGKDVPGRDRRKLLDALDEK